MEVNNVANFFIEMFNSDENGNITNMQLNKLLYFAQGWNLAKNNKPLFDSKIEAWKYGPVVPEIYHKYNKFAKENIPTNEAFISEDADDSELNLLIAVYNKYSRYSGIGLKDLTHQKGTPWQKAYKEGVKNIEIKIADIKEYFKNNEDNLELLDVDNIENIGYLSDGKLVLPTSERD